ncbi:hypothetical protein OC835_006318 [Tilletia horrida]|nr:hypothetical protein OC835_006318 [Tilletia horrida]
MTDTPSDNDAEAAEALLSTTRAAHPAPAKSAHELHPAAPQHQSPPQQPHGATNSDINPITQAQCPRQPQAPHPPHFERTAQQQHATPSRTQPAPPTQQRHVPAAQASAQATQPPIESSRIAASLSAPLRDDEQHLQLPRSQPDNPGQRQRLPQAFTSYQQLPPRPPTQTLPPAHQQEVQPQQQQHTSSTSSYPTLGTLAPSRSINLFPVESSLQRLDPPRRQLPPLAAPFLQSPRLSTSDQAWPAHQLSRHDPRSLPPLQLGAYMPPTQPPQPPSASTSAPVQALLTHPSTSAFSGPLPSDDWDRSRLAQTQFIAWGRELQSASAAAGLAIDLAQTLIRNGLTLTLPISTPDATPNPRYPSTSRSTESRTTPSAAPPARHSRTSRSSDPKPTSTRKLPGRREADHEEDIVADTAQEDKEPFDNEHAQEEEADQEYQEDDEAEEETEDESQPLDKSAPSRPSRDRSPSMEPSKRHPDKTSSGARQCRNCGIHDNQKPGSAKKKIIFRYWNKDRALRVCDRCRAKYTTRQKAKAARSGKARRSKVELGEEEDADAEAGVAGDEEEDDTGPPGNDEGEEVEESGAEGEEDEVVAETVTGAVRTSRRPDRVEETEDEDEGGEGGDEETEEIEAAHGGTDLRQRAQQDPRPARATSRRGAGLEAVYDDSDEGAQPTPARRTSTRSLPLGSRGGPARQERDSLPPQPGPSRRRRRDQGEVEDNDQPGPSHRRQRRRHQEAA